MPANRRTDVDTEALQRLLSCRSLVVGMTDRTPEVSAQELSNVAGALGRFTVARQWQLKDAATYERRISAILGCYRVSGEHFRLSVGGAIRRITAPLYSWGVVNEEGLTRG